MSRNRRVGVLNVSSTINKMFVQYGKVIYDVLDDSIKEVARESTEDLKAVNSFSPKGKTTGEYSNDWTWDVFPDKRLTRKVVIYNEDHYRLTHLLESGHSKYLWGRATGGKVQGYPHIKPINDKAHEHLEASIIRRIEDIDVDKL